MKKLLILILSLTLLSGCSKDETPAITKPELPPAVEHEQEEQVVEPSCAGDEALLHMELEHPVYDPSVERFTYFIRNDAETAVEFGAPYSIQRLENGAWRNLETDEETAWIAIGYMLQPGEIMALTGSFSMYRETPEAGTYRLVKTVGEVKLCAEFELGESIYTAEAPYGFAPLEQLRTDYSAASASELDVVFTADGVKNLDAVGAFLEKTGMGVDCQLRTVQDYGEGAPMVIDVIYEKGVYLWRMWSGEVVSEKYFSSIVSDGEHLYLSNGADWENTQTYQSDKVFLIPESVTVEMLTKVERQTAMRLSGNVSRYQIWKAQNDEGIWGASLWDSSEFPEDATMFSLEWRDSNGGGWGSTYNLRDWDGLETAITAIEWRLNGKLRLTCDTTDGGRSVLEFDPETEKLTSLAGEIPTKNR